jgi:hypothetical protein
MTRSGQESVASCAIRKHQEPADAVDALRRLATNLRKRFLLARPGFRPSRVMEILMACDAGNGRCCAKRHRPTLLRRWPAPFGGAEGWSATIVSSQSVVGQPTN